MLNGAVLILLFVLKKGQAAPVQTQHTVMAAVGDEACLSCRLTQHKEVLQVTWQKLSPEGEKNVATSTKYFGRQVNRGFREKVEFKDAGLQNSSIVIRNVTEQDEGCYACLFNSNPEGALTGRTCLKVYELHEPVLHVESNSAEEAVVSCSATGRPAPTVTLRVLQQDLHLSNYSSVSVTNTNSTVTVTSTAVLSGFHDDRTQVGCAVRVLSGPQKEVLMMIPEVKQSSADDFTWIIVLFVVLAFICLAVITVLLLRKRRHSSSHKDSEATKTPQKPTEHPHEPKTPLMQQVNENLRQWSTEKHHKGNDTETSSPCVKHLFSSNESLATESYKTNSSKSGDICNKLTLNV
ncbi:OX-2 membrane glycoprotein isoform X2 [Larimichthys crocea]|uniref:OX-2 membrane glycoprotein isoform X2 n=1 Tax=Larimichthys crocea TaxID=215358 RepID=UPI000F603121|nr:OX-2 membrane glycoprotein isoform X2 [Larimichthys crocea]